MQVSDNVVTLPVSPFPAGILDKNHAQFADAEDQPRSQVRDSGKPTGKRRAIPTPTLHHEYIRDNDHVQELLGCFGAFGSFSAAIRFLFVVVFVFLSA